MFDTSRVAGKTPWQMRREPNTIFVTMATQPQLVAVRLTELRQSHGLNQEDAAHKVGVGVRTWQRWEAGDSMPYPRNIESIANSFGISVEDFFDGPTQTQLDRIEQKLDTILAALTAPDSDPATVDSVLGKLSNVSKDVTDPARARPRKRGSAKPRG